MADAHWAASARMPSDLLLSEAVQVAQEASVRLQEQQPEAAQWVAVLEHLRLCCQAYRYDPNQSFLDFPECLTAGTVDGHKHVPLCCRLSCHQMQLQTLCMLVFPAGADKRKDWLTSLKKEILRTPGIDSGVPRSVLRPVGSICVAANCCIPYRSHIISDPTRRSACCFEAVFGNTDKSVCDCFAN